MGGIRTHGRLPVNWFRVISVWPTLDDFIRNCWNIAERQKSDEIRLCEGSKTQKPLKIWKRVKSDEIAISNIFLRFLLEKSLEMAYFLPLWRSIGSAFLRLRLCPTEQKIISPNSAVDGMQTFWYFINNLSYMTSYKNNMFANNTQVSIFTKTQYYASIK